VAKVKIMPTKTTTHTSIISQEFTGVALALLSVVVWAANFVIARRVIHEIPPVSLAFFRWIIAALIMIPVGYKSLIAEWKQVKEHIAYLFMTAFFGITLFNTMVYVAGHHTEAINMAMIGTTSSPIFSIILAFLILKEKPGKLRMLGMLICILGIIWLLVRGSLQQLLHFHLAYGDLWLLAGALCFAIYNIQVRRKPVGISSRTFLLAVFSLGSCLLLPGMLWEQWRGNLVHWSPSLISMLVYLGAFTSVIGFLAWNAAIARIGIGRTVLFGYLIPLVAALEAVLFLGEKFTTNHLISAVLVATGLFLTNLSPDKLGFRRKEIL
jgi:drug/metabolite transporter (DMT)-like permease